MTYILIPGRRPALRHGTAAAAPEPPDPGDVLTGWFSDWATQLADQGQQSNQANTDRLRDMVLGVQRWNAGSRNEHGEVVTTPSGHNAPFVKMLHCRFNGSSGGGLFMLGKQNLGTMATDQVRDFRWYEMFQMPIAAGANNGHGVGDDQGDSNMNWSQNRAYWNADDTRWRDAIWFFSAPGPNTPACSGECERYFAQNWSAGTGAAAGNNNFANDYQFLKNHLYMNCVKIKRVSATTWWFKRWIYDAETTPATLLFQPSDMYSMDGLRNFGEPVVKPIRVAATFGNFVIGQNGISPINPPFSYSHWGGAASADGLDEDTPIGEYPCVTNGVETEGE